ncbi:MAG TPA: class I SAM-dependent methyltransferase, partial [bacterium]|nr:class I SAM-dependent methyltransferase [bacterium]
QLRIMGVDQSPSMVKKAEQSNIVEIRIASLDAVGVGDDTFDAVVCIGVTEYLNDIPAVLREIGRLAKPGAPMLITFAPPVFWNYLRFGYGKTLRLISSDDASNYLQTNGWKILSQSTTSMQIQFLARNSA